MSANETTSISLTARTGQISLVSADKSLSEYTKKELTSCLDSLKTLLGNAKISEFERILENRADPQRMRKSDCPFGDFGKTRLPNSGR